MTPLYTRPTPNLLKSLESVVVGVKDVCVPKKIPIDEK